MLTRDFLLRWFLLPGAIIATIALLAHFNPGFASRLSSMLEEKDAPGKTSVARVLTCSSHLAVLLWVTHIVWITNVIPDLWGPSIFVSVMYSINIMPTLIAKWKGISSSDKDATAN